MKCWEKRSFIGHYPILQFNFIVQPHFIALHRYSVKALVKPFASIFHAVTGSVAPIIAFVLPVFYSVFRSFSDRITATFPEVLTVFDAIRSVFTTISAAILTRIYTFVYPQAFSRDILRY
jgi:phage-related protein